MINPQPTRENFEALLKRFGTPKEVAYALGCSVGVIYARLRKFGIKYGVDWAAELAKGGDAAEIAARLGCAKVTVYTRAKELGVALTPISRRVAAGDAWQTEILKARSAGETYASIAGRLGLTIRQVRVIAERQQRKQRAAAKKPLISNTIRRTVWVSDRTT